MSKWHGPLLFWEIRLAWLLQILKPGNYVINTQYVKIRFISTDFSVDCHPRMARTISAVARSKPTQLNLSRSVSSQLRRLLGDVETGTRLGQKPGEASVAHPSITDAEDQGKHPADPIFPFMSNENLSERTDRAKQESKPSSDPKESVLHNHPPPAEDANVVVKPLLKKSKSSKKRSPHRSAAGPKVAGIGLNSRMTSPFFSTPSAGLRGRTGTVSKSLVDFKTGAANSTSRPWEMQGRLAGRKCLITGATSGIGENLSLYIC